MGIFDITIPITIKAAELRAKYNIRAPDALRAATTNECQADYFLINDLRLKSVTEIKIVTLSELENKHLLQTVRTFLL
jgi:predicted nucleic acid-binding protein